MKKFIQILIIIIPFVSFSQNNLPLSISIYNESTALPFTRFLTFPIHPGAEIGTEIDWNKKSEFGLYQTFNLTYFFHQHLNQGIGLYSESGYKLRIIKKLNLSFLLGIGYMHTFATTEEFIFENGQYIKVKDYGNARLFPSISIKLGYNLKNIELFLKYQTWVEYPYSPDFIPVMTHNNLHLGCKIYFKKCL